MREYLPLLIVCAVIGVFTILFLAAYAVLKRKTKAETSERHMSDSEIIKRLLGYARPYKKDFVLVFLIMLVSIAYDVVSPLLVADIQGTIKQSFELSRLYSLVAVYAGILAVSMVCTYFQAMILQKTGQKILSQIRLDTFTHIEQLSHAQLNQIPVGKLVTRVTNDPNSISYLFTNILVTLAKNSLVIIGVLAAMLILNYALTLMVLCFVPFLVLFTIIFQKFSRHVHRTVNNARTDVNTYLSENLSGMKVTQIFNQEQRKMDEFLARSKRLEKTKMNRMFVFGIFRPMVYMLFVTSNLFLFYIGCKGYIKDTTFLGQTITSETVVAFYMYISRFFNPIQALAALTVRREKCNLWYSQALYSRRNAAHTPILLIMQRLHEKDLVGYVRATEGGQWHILSIPVVDDDGAMLWPETFDHGAMERLKALDPFAFSAQYMQAPTPPGGAMIKTGWIRRFGSRPAGITSVGIFADTAQKAGQHNDFTVFILAGTDGRNVYILDLLRDRLEAPDLISAAKAFYERHRPNRITNPVRFAGFFVEDKVSGTGLIQTLRRETDIPVIPIQRDRDKVSRVNDVLPYIRAGRLFVPEDAPWVNAYIGELAAFSPAMTHEHDDQVDPTCDALSELLSPGGNLITGADWS